MVLTRNRLAEYRAALQQAESYASWLEIAKAHDEATGATDWQADDDSPHYDAGLLRRETGALRAMRIEGDALGLAERLTHSVYRHLNEVTTPALYQQSLAGTKRLVASFLDEVEQSLEWLARTPIPGMSAAVKLQRFEEAWQVFGRSALMLSGGATLGFYHLGVVKELFEHRLLPRILTGASTGAMIAAGVCTRDDEALAAMFADPDTIRRDGLLRVPLRLALRRGAFLEPGQLYEVLKHNVGNFTFAEAYARSGRVLNISVSPTRTRQKPRLLTHLTSPDVLVASAALASSALPGLFPPVVLQARGRDDSVRPYIPSESWVDGSLYNDLPKLRLSRLHNVNHFIVSQTNPHVLPFVSHRGKRGVLPAMFGLTSATVRTQGAHLIDVVRRATGRGVGGLRRFADQAHALVSQDYRGDIDIHPAFHPGIYRKMVANPTRRDLDWFILQGQRAVWPQMAMIRDHTRVGRAFERCVAALRDTSGGG